MSFKQLCNNLEAKIQSTYESGVTLDVAEKLAGEFLYAQLQVSAQLKTVSLDARMRKSGVKSVRAAAYLNIVKQADKKPTETQIASMIDSDEIVGTEQQSLDKAEVDREELERYYEIFQNAHIHFRGIAKGRFD